MNATPKKRLLEAVVAVALNGGIADKSLRAIADASGTSHRMLIHHFGSRDNLLVEVIRVIEARQQATLSTFFADGDATPNDAGLRLWAHLRSPSLAPQERLFFEIYGQALQGRDWAKPLFDGVVENWVRPLATILEKNGLSSDEARIVARLSVAVTRGLLLDVLATGEDLEVDEAMQLFSTMLPNYLSARALSRKQNEEKA